MKQKVPGALDPELMEHLLSGRGFAERQMAAFKHEHLLNFIRESNSIENIKGKTRKVEVLAHREFLACSEVSVFDLELFVKRIGGKPLRRTEGMDVSIVDRSSGRLLYRPPRGGPDIEGDLREILIKAERGDNTPFEIHCAYEALHPFLDGNGRSGRVLWAWQMLHESKMPFGISFLRAFYYQTLQASR